tara:strand:+ start:1355 stop:2632 length:1278 start_codon:yes stop_codon:yes gene_type:complete
MNEENRKKWPEKVKEKLQAYADRTDKQIGEAANEFIHWLKKEYHVDDPLSEDEYLLNEWAEVFCVETRNLGPSTGDSRDELTMVGHILALDEYINDLRSKQYEQAIGMWRSNSDRAIDEKMLGIVTAKDGTWCVNGEPTKEKVEGSELPWFAFEYEDRILCLLNRNQSSQSVGKPMAPKSLIRTMFFLGNTEDKFENEIKLWRIGLQGGNIKAEYNLHEPCKVKVIPPKEGSTDVYTKRNFNSTIEYTDSFVPEDMRPELQASRFLINDRIHDYYVELDELLEAYDDKSTATQKNPFIITKGNVSRMNKEHMDSEYDQTGRNFRLSVTSLGLQSSYGRDSSMSEVTVWIPGRTYDDGHPFEYNNGGEWTPYAEKTPVIICGRLKLRPYNGQDVPSVTAQSIFVPPRTARPGASGGDTSLDQFGGN